MELLRSGARVSDDLEAMLNANLQDIFKQGRAEWQAKKIEKEGLIQYAHHLFQGVHKDSWEVSRGVGRGKRSMEHCEYIGIVLRRR